MRRLYRIARAASSGLPTVISLRWQGWLQCPGLQAGHLQNFRRSETRGVNNPAAKEFGRVRGDVSGRQQLEICAYRDAIGKRKVAVLMVVMKRESQACQEICGRQCVSANVNAGGNAPVCLEVIAHVQGCIAESRPCEFEIGSSGRRRVVRPNHPQCSEREPDFISRYEAAHRAG